MAFSLDGKVALVTGSSTGLGKGIALALGEAGAKVAINYFNNVERAERAFDEYRANGAEGMLVRGNVAEDSGVDDIFTAIEKELGEVDIVVIDATPDQPQMPIEDYTWKHYENMIDFFIKSPYLLARRCLPSMKRKGQGRIINIGSEVYQRAVGNFSAYVAAKGAQAGWTRSMASELSPAGITVNLVAPGWIPVERHEKDPQEIKDEYFAAIPMGRWGKPADVAHAVLYFASEEAAFVTGQCVCVNGGMSPIA